MTWASLRGIPLPVLRGTWRRTDARMGEQVRTTDGSLVSTVVAELETFDGITKALTREKRDAFVGLVKGLGEVWLWDADHEELSSKGTGQTATPTVTTSGGKFSGTGYVTAGSGASIVFSTSLTRRWWIEVWRYETHTIDGGGILVGADGWHHYVIHGEGAMSAGANPAGVTQYRDGVVGNWNAGEWFGMDSSGRFALRGKNSAGGNASKDYSQVIAQPFHGLSTWPAIAAARTIAEAPLERLWLEGDDVGDARMVTGTVRDIDTIAGYADGTEMHGRRMSFQLADAADASL